MFLRIQKVTGINLFLTLQEINKKIQSQQIFEEKIINNITPP